MTCGGTFMDDADAPLTRLSSYVSRASRNTSTAVISQSRRSMEMLPIAVMKQGLTSLVQQANRSASDIA